jgi:hypothetical protein
MVIDPPGVGVGEPGAAPAAPDAVSRAGGCACATTSGAMSAATSRSAPCPFINL